MSAANLVQAIDLLMAVTNASMRLQELLQRAAAEGRDITDEELAAWRAGNDAKSAALIESLERGA